MDIEKTILRIDSGIILLREEFNDRKEYHLAGELSAISIILCELERYCFENKIR